MQRSDMQGSDMDDKIYLKSTCCRADESFNPHRLLSTPTPGQPQLGPSTQASAIAAATERETLKAAHRPHNAIHSPPPAKVETICFAVPCDILY
jgi:hypothetical protein